MRVDHKCSFAQVIFRSIENFLEASRSTTIKVPISESNKKELWGGSIGLGVECVKRLGRIRNHFSHEIRSQTRKCIAKAQELDPDNTILQDLFNVTVEGYKCKDGYRAAMSIFATVALYKSSSKQQRSHDKNGVMTPFACELLHNKLVQQRVTLSEEAFALLCIRKEIVRGLNNNNNKKLQIFRQRLQETIVEPEVCVFTGRVEDLFVFAKDGFRTEEINLFLEMKKMLKSQRKDELNTPTDDQISRFNYPISPSHVLPPSSKKRRLTDVVNSIDIDSDDEKELQSIIPEF